MTTVLFIGGPRHGQDIDVKPQLQSLLDIATDQPTKLPTSYVDIVSASTYFLREFKYVLANPVTGRPTETYTNDVYVHETLNPADASNALSLAVLGRWFVEHGTLQPTPTGSPVTP